MASKGNPAALVLFTKRSQCREQVNKDFVYGRTSRLYVMSYVDDRLCSVPSRIASMRSGANSVSRNIRAK